MAGKKKFFTDNMTVDHILNLDYQTLNKLDTREVSRALRTASLAANKRLNRLRKNAVYDKEKGYLPKAGSNAMAPYALNAVTQDGKKKFKWGVEKTHGSRNKMLKQLKEIREFWNMSTSTVKKAVEVRKESEKRLFGQTREEAAKYKRGAKRESIYRQYDERMKNAFEAYRKFLEYRKVNKWSSYEGSASILSVIGNEISTGNADIDDAISAAIAEDEKLYQKRQDEFRSSIEGKDYFEY